MTSEAHLLRCALPKGTRRLEASQLRCTLPRELVLLRSNHFINQCPKLGQAYLEAMCRVLRAAGSCAAASILVYLLYISVHMYDVHMYIL